MTPKVDNAIERLQLLQELDYGDEELLGDDIEIFNKIIPFFYRIKDEYKDPESFFLSLIESNDSTVTNSEFEECLKNLHKASEKLTDFETLCKKLDKPNETLIRKIEQIISLGQIQVNDLFEFR